MVGLSTPDITRRYEYTADGELCSAEEIHADGTRSRVSLVFDEEGRVVAEEGIRGTLGYEYDRRDNRTVTQLPDGRKLRSHYYGSGHLLQMALDERVLTEFSRDALHRETRRTQGQVFTQRRYDRLGRPCWRGIYHESSPLRAERECWQEYDLRHNLVREREVVKSPWPWKEYGYEAGDYLQEYRTCTGIREQFSYDAAGNIREHASSGPCRHNRLEAFRGHGYRYDVYGRMVERELPGGEIQKLEYDTFHRLVKVTCTPADWNMLIRYVNYDYDALNRRVRKWVKYERHAGSFSGRERETETWFLWEGMRLLGEEENGRPVVYVYEGPGSYVPLARIDGGREKATIRWYHCGVNGAPDRVTNEEGKTEWRHDTGGWGQTESEYEYGMIRENLRYQGQYLDRETGLHYNLHRYFVPECGRFIQPDPISLAGGINLYLYAPNPIGWIDPWGLTAKDLANNMEADGRPLSPGQTPHHAVKENANNIYAEGSRNILTGDGANPDVSENGARLWGTHPNQAGQPGHPGVAAARNTGNYHAGTHIHGKFNDKLIYQILRNAKRKGINSLRILSEITKRMESGLWKKSFRACGGK
ncbi:TPA: RHS domain-containing protein [Escherichia albertii]|uniref:RHS domain-containing protein n=2 Tax=Escherichia albertii TaxID=208962 RepID=A0ABD7EEK2_ESCAL|nr:RHS domain-containing protein [Escherichia albertii]HEB1082952.1 RHS domain-containing protein [Escherichia albertii]HEB1102675.1 RHS domain-containing protein [Escherichia albertii]HEB1107347.1 RHS domain-containing protein [Escherichia albertii]HEB1184035.1 RHS domain-containing protein [Escherichia albertii]